MLKYARTIVIRMTQTEWTTLCGTGIPVRMMSSTSGSAKLSAANAPPKKLAKVIATWMVDRKRAGCDVSLTMRFARRSPFSAIFCILVSLAEITAISALAKIPLKKISTI